MDKKIWEILNRSLETFSQNIIDGYVEVNVKYRSQSGIKAVIVRRELGHCCNWCHEVAGIYDYDSAPRDIYRRHDNCRCLVTFKSDKGHTDVWSRIEYKNQRQARVARIKEIYDHNNRLDELNLLKRKAQNEGKLFVDSTEFWIKNKYFRIFAC